MLVPYNVDVPMARVPIANWVLIGLTCLVSVGAFIREYHLEHHAPRRAHPALPRDADEDADAWPVAVEEDDAEAVPPLSLRWDRLVLVWLFTHQFVHGGPLHLIGNMVFLFCFGNAVNAKLGHWQFLLSYLLLGALAGLAWLPFSGGRPAVGASGAIMGIVGLFVVLFPRNDVEIFYWFGLAWAGVTRISAFLVVLFYVLGDLVGVLIDRGGPVAYVAHLGGAAAGFALGLALVGSRLVRSTRDEENLLEFLGYQRKESPRRKKGKKARRARAPRTVEELLADGSDLDICQGVFRRVVRRTGGEITAVGLGPEERVVVLVWHSVGLVDEGGFRALFEEGIAGDRRWARTVEAYHTIGCPRAAIALRKTAARLSGADTGEYADERAERSLRELTGQRSAEERQFMQVIDEVEGRLAEYIRAHRDFFLTLDDDD
jgi:membrane associated rhomboid family serine protease